MTIRSSMLVFLALLSSGLSHGSDLSIQTATNALKQCVAKALPGEREKANPSPAGLLATCDAEFQALINLVPVASQHEVKHLIEKDLAKQLTG